MYNIHLYILDVVKLSTITIDVHRQRLTKKKRKTKGGRNLRYTYDCTRIPWQLSRRQKQNIHPLAGSVVAHAHPLFAS